MQRIFRVQDIPGAVGVFDTAGLMTWPLASRISRFTLSAVGVNRVTSPMTCRICGFASIVAVLRRSSSPAAAICGGFMMLGGALTTPTGPAADTGVKLTLGGGTDGTMPGGRTSRGGGIPSETTSWHQSLVKLAVSG